MQFRDQYRAFISYKSEPKDQKWANWLHKSIESWRVPRRIKKWDPSLAEGLRPIFIDEAEGKPGPDLAEFLKGALRRSEWLIVVWSPRTSQSEYVPGEIDDFIELGRGDRILHVVVEGDPVKVLGEFATERNIDIPLGVDLRSRRKKRDALLRLLASILGVPFDELKQREERRRKWLFGVLAVALTAVLSSAGFFYWKYTEKHLDAWASSVGLEAVDALEAEGCGMGGRDLAALLAVEACSIGDGLHGRSSLLAVLGDEPAQHTFLHGDFGALTYTAFCPGGRLLLAGDVHAALTVFDMGKPRGSQSVQLPGTAITAACWLDERRVFVGTKDGAVFLVTHQDDGLGYAAFEFQSELDVAVEEAVSQWTPKGDGVTRERGGLVAMAWQDGTLFLAYDAYSGVAMVDLSQGRTQIFQAPGEATTFFGYDAMSGDKRFGISDGVLYCASVGGYVMRVDLADQGVPGQELPEDSVAFDLLGGGVLICADRHGHVWRIDLASGERSQIASIAPAYCATLACDSASGRIYLGTRSGGIHVIDEEGEALGVLSGHLGVLTDLDSSHGRYLASADQCGQLILWRPQEGLLRNRIAPLALEEDAAPMDGLKAGEGETLVLGGHAAVAVFDVSDPGRPPALRSTYALEGGIISSLAYLESGEVLVVGTEEGRVFRIPNAKGREARARIDEVAEAVQCPASIRALTVGDGQGWLAVTETGALVHSSDGESIDSVVETGVAVDKAVISPDRRYVSIGSSGNVLLCCSHSGEVLERAEEEGNWFASALSNRYWSYGGQGGRVTIWDLDEGTEVGQFPTGLEEVTGLSMTEDGALLAASGIAGGALVDTATGSSWPLASVPSESEPFACSVDLGGAWVVFDAMDDTGGAVWFIDLRLQEVARLLAGRGLTEDEQQTHLARHPPSPILVGILLLVALVLILGVLLFRRWLEQPAGVQRGASA